MLFDEVQLCVQHPSSCCSSVVVLLWKAAEARGMKDAVSAFPLPFYSWDIVGFWTEQEPRQILCSSDSLLVWMATTAPVPWVFRIMFESV